MKPTLIWQSGNATPMISLWYTGRLRVEVSRSGLSQPIGYDYLYVFIMRNQQGERVQEKARARRRRREREREREEG